MNTAPPAATEYVVLRENKSEPNNATPQAGTHTVVKTIAAANAHDAIRQAIDNKPGTYRAIPARSWRPVTVQVETKTTLKLT